MKFSYKLFLSIFLVSTACAVGILLVTYNLLVASYERDFKDSYDDKMDRFAMTFHQLEDEADQIAINALKTLYERDRRGILSNEELKAAVAELGISNAFVINKKGTFVRYTLGEKEMFPNLFKFCADYKKLVGKDLRTEMTPIMPDYEFEAPYKYVMMSNHDRTRILEVGMHLEFFRESLKEIFRTDTNISKIGIYTPSGTSLGAVFASDHKRSNASGGFLLPQLQETVVEKKIYSTVRDCCECRKKQIVQSGEDYHYILKASVVPYSVLAKAETLRNYIGLSLLGAILLSILLAYRMSRVHVRRFGQINEKLRHVVDYGDLNVRCHVDGGDEVEEMSRNIDSVLSWLQNTQRRIREVEKRGAYQKVARSVAHDLRAPLSALEVQIGSLHGISETERGPLKKAISRIREVADGVLKQYRSLPADQGELTIGCRDILEEKKQQYPKVIFSLEAGPLADSRILLPQGELKRILSNLIDNAQEAGASQIRLEVKEDFGTVRIAVSDNGKGISKEIIPRLFKEGATFNKKDGTGIGLYHAQSTIQSFGGRVSLESKKGRGTTVSIFLPLADVSKKLKICDEIQVKPNSIIAVVDDEAWVVDRWRDQFSKILEDRPNVRFEAFHSLEEFRGWIQSLSEEERESLVLLMDHEFSGSDTNGFDVVVSSALVDSAVLVTGRAPDPDIQLKCSQVGLRLMDKLKITKTRVIHSDGSPDA